MLLTTVAHLLENEQILCIRAGKIIFKVRCLNNLIILCNPHSIYDFVLERLTTSFMS